MNKVIIREVTTQSDLEAVRALCWAYRDFLLYSSDAERRVTQAYYSEPVYIDLMQRLVEIHAPPLGSLKVAILDGTIVGCGMSYQISDGVAEIKRVFVTDAARGLGVGRLMCQSLIGGVRGDGYHTVMLDTSKSLTSARRLYESLGFQERGPFYDVPRQAEGFACFYERRL